MVYKAKTKKVSLDKLPKDGRTKREDMYAGIYVLLKALEPGEALRIYAPDGIDYDKHLKTVQSFAGNCRKRFGFRKIMLRGDREGRKVAIGRVE